MSGGEETAAVLTVMEAEEGPERLLAAVRAGRTSWIPVLVGKLDAAQRRAALAGLKELRKEMRDQWSRENLAVRGALLVAGAGCHTGPAGAATWMSGSDFSGRDWARSRELAKVVEAQPVEWQIEVATRLAERPSPRWGWWLYYPLVDSVVKRTGCPVPTSEAFVRAWLVQDFQEGRRGTALVERLRADPYTPVLVPRLFELSDVAHELSRNLNGDAGDSWATAIAALAATGELDRAGLLDGCLARLLRGGKAPDQKEFLEILSALDPTPEEYAARARDLLALLDGPSVLAGHAQEVLAGLDEAGLIEPEALVEASAVVLFRTEKKLVRAQLGWLEKAARRSPERAGPAALAAAEAFGHPDAGVQERALNVVARQLRAAGEAVLPELRQAAELLSPVHHARAGELFGAPVGGEAAADTEEVLPPVPVPLPLGEPVASAAELAEELSALLAQERPEVAVFERVLDGLIRQTHLDREGLLAALEPVRRAHPWNGGGHWGDCVPQDVLYVVASIAGETPPHRLWDALRGKKRSPLRSGYSTVHGSALAARLEEAAWQVTATRPPYLLATPTDASGALDPAALVARLAGYESAGMTPGHADLSAALLRVGPLPADEAVLRAAGALTSPAGQELAQWLRGGGLPAQPSERVLFEPARASGRSLRPGEHWFEDVRRVAVAQPGIGADVAKRLAAEFRELLAATEPSVARSKRNYDWAWRPIAHWAAMLPWHREELAARWLDHFAEAADRDQRGPGRLLPQLAEAGGPAGLAVHLALAYCLGSATAEDRTGAVDALLVLAARGDLDPGLLGRELGELAVLGTVKTNRLAASLALAAETGAHRTVWSVLAAVLPVLLASADPAPRGVGDLLTVAADTARRTPDREPIAQVTALAARTGSSRTVKAARTLRDVLGDS
ncbi:DUF6493 family protein [Kitasatospora sp. NPDC051170]|uniref:DUF7824 domain-containing protein n=1 Tax=Kitasatospora sp. NPDC051170 TaxID=3364056 RepID=UPI0037950C34